MFLIFELIIYFSKPKDLSSSLIRGELFSFTWQTLTVALEEIQEGLRRPPCPWGLRPKDVESCDVMLCVFGLRSLSQVP